MISIKIQTCNICHKWEIIFKILHSPLPPSCNHCYAWFACPPPDSKMDIGLARLMEMSFMREYNPKYNHPATLCFGMKNKKPLLITSISSFIGCSWETFFLFILDLTQMWSSCRLKSSRFAKADSQNFSTSGDRIILEHNSFDFSHNSMK